MSLIIVGVLFLIISAVGLAIKEKGKADVAVGGFIGPIPFGFFTSKKAF